MYSALKNELADVVIAKLEPIQNRHRELMGDKGELRLLKDGARTAARAQTLSKVYKKMGLVQLPR